MLAFLSDRWALGPVHTVEVIADPGTELLINGYPSGHRFTGRYLDSMSVEIRAPAQPSDTYWLVDGERRSATDEALVLTIVKNTQLALH